MIKIRLLHKGLFLVTVPLLAGVGFFSLLHFELSQTNRLIERELLLKDAEISHVKAVAADAAALVFSRIYQATQNISYYRLCAAEQKKAFSSQQHLKELLKQEPEIKVPPLSISRFEYIMGEPEKTSPELQEFHAVCDGATKSAISSINSVYITFIIGFVACIFISLILALFFCLNITNRLLIIVNNTRSLTGGTPLSPPIEGTDEIAELDAFFYKSASAIRELERFKKEMIGVVSHELKSPLSSVNAFLSSMQAGVLGELSERAMEKVQRTQASIKRLMGLVADLLLLDKLQLQINRQDMELAVLLKDSIDTIKELSEKSSIEIVVKGCDGEIYADRNRLLQVIVNLLSNALKFSPPGGRILLETKLDEGLLECRVTDEGKGIPEGLRKQIFEPFKQVDAKDEVAKKGTGLGLTISRSIVEQHGGLIDVESELGKGSTFFFRIPAQRGVKPLSSSVDSIVSKNSEAQKNAKPVLMKFSVLQQGLLIISIPLLFQIIFSGFVACFAYQVHQQILLEEKSKELVGSVSRVTELAVRACKYGFMYVYLKDPNLLETWKANVQEAFVLLGKANNLASAKELKHIGEIKSQLLQMSSTFDAQAAGVENKGTLRPNESRAKTLQTFFPAWARMAQERMPKDAPAKGEPTEAEEQNAPSLDAAGKLQRMQFMQTMLKTTLTQHLVKPFVRLQSIQAEVLTQEKDLGETLARQRASMIQSLELSLTLAVVASFAVSTLITIFLLRSLAVRLKHVMYNTERLVKREPLDPPQVGSDEIAFLDKVLFETGNHLLELEAFKRELVSVVSHELRTPLLSVSSALELLDRGVLGQLSDKAKVRLKIATGETTRLIRLINDLLDIEKMEAGKFVLDISNFSLIELIHIAKASVEGLADARNIRLDCPERHENEQTLPMDKDRVCQVLINLLSNAIKFSPEFGIIKVRVSSDDKGTVTVSVADQGRGIPKEMRDKIFGRFVQIEQTDESEKGGTGLGLAISKAIVEQHGGSIGVDSVPGSGSTFWFTLPTNSTLLA